MEVKTGRYTWRSKEELQKIIDAIDLLVSTLIDDEPKDTRFNDDLVVKLLDMRNSTERLLLDK